jgi:hypothetical protein
MRFEQAHDLLDLVTRQEGSPRQAYSWDGPWLVQRRLLRTALSKFSAIRNIPGLKVRDIVGTWLSRTRLSDLNLPSSADAIQVGKPGTRLRTFQYGKRVTLKAVREDSHYGPATRRELNWRAAIPKTSSLLIPQVLGHECRDGVLRVEEQLVTGHRYSVRRNRALFFPHIVAPMARFYEDFGVQRVPLSQALGPVKVFLDSHQAECGSDLKRLLELDPEVAISLCHHDLVSSNLAVTAAGVYFLDWGASSLGICGRDFLRIGRHYMNNKAMKEELNEHIRKLHNGKLTLDQLVLIQHAYSAYLKFHRDDRLDISAAVAP